MTHRLSHLLFAFAAFAAALSLVHASPALAQGDRPITHAFFVAGPSFTGIIDEQGQTQWAAPRTNGARDGFVLDNGHIIITYGNEVLEFDNDKEVVWRYQLHASNGEISTAQRLDNGNTLIATGNGHSVIEVSPDKEVVWHLAQDDLEGIRLAWVTTLQVLPNGNYVIGNCHAGPDNPQVIEVTRDKKVVWTFHDFERFGDALSNSQVVGEDAEPYHR